MKRRSHVLTDMDRRAYEYFEGVTQWNPDRKISANGPAKSRSLKVCLCA